MYDDHLKLIGKRVVDFLLELIELFSLGVTAHTLRVVMFKRSSNFRTSVLNYEFEFNLHTFGFGYKYKHI